MAGIAPTKSTAMTAPCRGIDTRERAEQRHDDRRREHDAPGDADRKGARRTSVALARNDSRAERSCSKSAVEQRLRGRAYAPLTSARAGMIASGGTGPR